MGRSSVDRRSLASADRLAETPPGPESTAELIRLVDVEKQFAGPPPVQALRGVSLGVGDGDYVAITGPSGSGKSTLLNIIGMLDTPTAGEYRFQDVDVASQDDGWRARTRALRIGLVFQRFHLLEGRTATENAALGLLYRGLPPKERRARARRALVRVGLEHRLDAPTSVLSGGEQQRVAVARALVGEPSLLLCDEPTGNLDSANANNVFDLLGELHQAGQTVVVITHDDELALRAERQIIIRDGEVA